MTNSTSPASNTRKESFIPLRLGPVARAKTLMDSLCPPSSNYVTKNSRVHGAPNASAGSVKYPRIIVRDVHGRVLDTFTTLQEAIYRASWTRKKTGEYPKTPLEWRLPKAPVPSKPDFSRAGPPRAVTSLHQESGTRLRSYSPSVTSTSYGKSRRIDLTADILVDVPVLEIPVDDVSFVAQSLQHLPNLPSFSFLRHSLLAGQSTYVQIVASILLHQRLLKATDARQADWEFPGFCSGCKRAGFCYGCSKSSKPHVHHDVPAMTGGGFRFWKPDRPRDPHAWKNPNNWKLPSTENELQDIIRKYGGLAAYEKAVIAARRDMMTSQYDVLSELASQGKLSDGRKLERITTLSAYPPQVTIVSNDQLEGNDDDDDDDDALVDNLLDEYSRGGSDGIDSRRMRERHDRRDRSLSQDTFDSRSRRIGVTSYKDDVASASSRSTRNFSHGSSGSFRIDTGLGDEWTEDDKDEGIDDTEDMDIENRTRGRKGHKVSIIEPPDSSNEENRARKLSRLSRSSRTQSHSIGRLSAPHRSTSTGSRSSWMTSRGTDKGEEDSEKTRKLKEHALQNIPFAKKRREPLYRAPRFFTVQKRNRKALLAQDPFSKDRDLNVPTGPGFHLKKNDKREIKFVEFKRKEGGWTAPKAFEVKKADKTNMKFWSPKKTKADDEDEKRRRRGQSKSIDRLRQRSRGHSSPDSGLHSATTDREIQQEPTPEPDVQAGGDQGLSADVAANENGADKATATDNTGVADVQKPKRREIVKKSKPQTTVSSAPIQNPPRLPSPPPFVRRETPPPTTPSPQRTPSPPPLPELPVIDLPDIPDLPEIKDKEAERRKQKLKFLVEPPSSLQEGPKKRRAPPKVRLLPKHLSQFRKTKPAEAPVPQDELINMHDPLDFLAKYCIINPDRLPFYEIIFETTVSEQDPRYAQEKKDGEEKENGEVVAGDSDKDGIKKTKDKGKKKKSKSATEKKSDQINPDLILADRSLAPEKAAMTVEEQHLEKIIYTLELLHEKLTSLGMQLEDMENRRTQILAHKARETFPEVTAPDYFPKTKKKGKKGKKSKSPVEQPRRLRSDEITDEVIVARLDMKMLTELSMEPEIRQLDVEMARAKEKISDIQRRVEEMARERLLADAFCMNNFFLRQGLSKSKSNENQNEPIDLVSTFKRQQSEMYNRLHPMPDFEMNIEEVEGALQQINNHLLTEKEVFFLYSILNLPRREKINFRLFSIIAALSEKVSQLDPVIKKLINNFNYNALDVKMEKCKELFDLLEAGDMPKGGAMASSLAVELNAGGLRPEHTQHVLHKFNREHKGVVDFLDFVTYVPLFVEIHKRIIQDPLRVEQDL